jgi:hypothetical protein
VILRDEFQRSDRVHGRAGYCTWPRPAPTRTDKLREC